MAVVIFILAMMQQTLAAFEQWISAQLQHGSYLVLFGLLFSCGLGLPLPEDIPLLISGAMVAAGKMNLALACICAWCGIVGGDVVLYHIGRTFGLEVRKAPLIGRHLSQKRLDQVHALFEKYGVWVVAVGRMFAGIRGAMVVVAGTTRFTFWKFLLADGIAALFSGGLFVFLGYQFGKNMDALREHVEKAKTWTLVIVLVLAAGIGIWIYFRRRKYRADERSEKLLKNNLPAADQAG
ncbi:MAG TPA: DedA family protein [Tepidisphaeraceae bacterium]|jgi:membrane protein DedA with SNARE-associated domain